MILVAEGIPDAYPVSRLQQESINLIGGLFATLTLGTLFHLIDKYGRRDVVVRRDCTSNRIPVSRNSILRICARYLQPPIGVFLCLSIRYHRKLWVSSANL